MCQQSHKINTFLIETGRRLKTIRQMRGVSQNQLARDTGVGRLIIVGAEKGERDLRSSAVVAICEYLDCDPCWLLGVEPRDHIWNGVLYRTTVETLPVSTGLTYTPIGEDE